MAKKNDNPKKAAGSLVGMFFTKTAYFSTMCGAYAALLTSDNPKIQMIVEGFIKMGKEFVLPVAAGTLLLGVVSNIINKGKKDKQPHTADYDR